MILRFQVPPLARGLGICDIEYSIGNTLVAT